MHTEPFLQADQPLTEPFVRDGTTQGHDDMALGTSTDLAEEDEISAAPQRHKRHADAAASHHPVHANSAVVTAELTQHHAQPELEDSLFMQRQDSHGTATTSRAAQSSSSSISSSSGSSASQNSSMSSGQQGTGSDMRSSYNSSTIWKASSMDQEVVNSNATGMQISFLGTASSVDCKSRFCLGAPPSPPHPKPPPPPTYSQRGFCIVMHQLVNEVALNLLCLHSLMPTHSLSDLVL